MTRTVWATVQEIQAETGRSEAAIRAAGRASRFKTRKKDGRLQIDREAALNYFRNVDAHGLGRPSRPAARGPGELTVAEFAMRAGVHERYVHKLKREGRIAGYTVEALEKYLREREGESERPVQESGLADLEQASLNDIRRTKEFHQARLAKLKADEAEGKVYDAAAVEARVRRLAQATQAAFRELPMVLPAKLVGLEVAEVRSVLARWAQDRINTLVALTGTGAGADKTTEGGKTCSVDTQSSS
jgi:phage terminase Nu1 subunit (DNA packaging protein)